MSLNCLHMLRDNALPQFLMRLPPTDQNKRNPMPTFLSFMESLHSEASYIQYMAQPPLLPLFVLKLLLITMHMVGEMSFNSLHTPMDIMIMQFLVALLVPWLTLALRAPLDL